MNRSLIAVILIAASSFILMGFAWPTFSYIRSLDQAISEREAMITERTAIIDNIEKAAAEYQQNIDNINKFSLVIPPKKSVPEIITSMETITLKNNIALNNLNLSENTQQDTYSNINLETNLRGAYGSLINLLGDIERNVRLFDVAIIKMQPSDNSPANIDMTLNGNVYFLK